MVERGADHGRDGRMSSVVVGFISEKGGTGKTTACYHIAVGLARFHNKRVLVVDADYQRGGITGRFFPSLIEHFDSDSMDGITMFHKFQELYSAGERSNRIDVRSWSNKIDVAVSDPRLSTVTEDKLPSSQNIKQNNALLLRHLQVFHHVLCPLKKSYDYIFIDSHPEVSGVLRSIIYAADHCVSPVKFDRQSSIGVATVIGEVNNVNADVEMVRSHMDVKFEYTKTKFSGSIGMMAREYGGDLKHSEKMEHNRLRYNGFVFKTYVTEGDGLRKALIERCPVYDLNDANAKRQSEQFRTLVEEFIEKCQ